MAALTITVAQVKKGAGAVLGKGTAGATITAGQTLYEDAADGLLKPAVNTALATARCVGVSLHAALANQEVTYQKGGKCIVGLTTAPAVGVIYCVGASGELVPSADVTSGKYQSIVGVGDGAGGIDMPAGGPFNSGKAV